MFAQFAGDRKNLSLQYPDTRLLQEIGYLKQPN